MDLVEIDQKSVILGELPVVQAYFMNRPNIWLVMVFKMEGKG